MIVDGLGPVSLDVSHILIEKKRKSSHCRGRVSSVKHHTYTSGRVSLSVDAIMRISAEQYRTGVKASCKGARTGIRGRSRGREDEGKENEEKEGQEGEGRRATG